MENNDNEIYNRENSNLMDYYSDVNDLKKDSKEKFKGLVNKEFFLNKYYDINEDKYNLEEYIICDVERDGNCGYRAFALQIYGDEEKHPLILSDIYNYLKNKEDQYANLIQ